MIDAKSAEIVTLKATVDRYNALVETLTPQLEAESADWPEEARAMLALGETLEKKLAIMPSARSLAAKLANKGAPPPPSSGTGNMPPPAGDAGSAEADARARAADSARYRR